MHHHKLRLFDKIKLEKERIDYAFHTEVEDIVESLTMTLIAISNDQKVKSAIKTCNKDILYNDWRQTFQELQVRFGVNHFTFADSSLNRILRVHKPKLSSGKVNRTTSLSAKKTSNISWGIEVQPNLKELPVLRVVKPIFEKEEVIGFVELGIEIDRIIDIVYKKTGNPYILLSHKGSIDKKDWENRAKYLTKDLNWNTFSEYAITKTSLTDIPDIIPKNIDILLGNTDENFAEIKIQDGFFALSYVDIVDVNKNLTGKIYFLSDITSLKDSLRWGRIKSIFFSGIVILVLFSFVYYMLSKTDRFILSQNRVLKESENKYRVLFDKISYGVLLHDINGNFIDVNQKAIDNHGFSRKELLNMKVEDIIHRDYLQILYDNLPKVLAGEKLLIETVHIRKDGSSFPVEVQPSIVDINQKSALLTVVRDLTETKKNDQKIQYQSTLFQAILNTTHDGFWIVDKKGQIVEVNDNYCKMSGYSREEILELKVTDIESYSSSEIPVQSIKSLYDKGSAKFDAIHKRKDGSLLNVRISLSVNKKQNETITFIEDISHIKEYEQKLVQSNNRFKLAEAAGNIASWEWNRKNDRMVVSDNAASILGYEPGDLLPSGKDFLEHIYVDDQGVFLDTLSESIDKRKDFRLEFRIRQKNGSVIWVLIMASITLDDMDEPELLFGVIQNIDQRKLNEIQLEKSLREKELLLNEIHHRVKNNLQIISSLIYLQSLQIEDGGIKELFSHSLNRIKSMALLHELLYQSKNFGSVNIYQYIKRIVFELQEAYNSSVSLILNIDSECSIKTKNAVYYGLIVNELISNAFKHAFDDYSKGKITVGFDYSKPNDLVLSVSDNGKGIKNMDEIMRSNSLGFKIVRTLANQLNGSIKFTGEMGTSIEISFPKD